MVKIPSSWLNHKIAKWCREMVEINGYGKQLITG